MKRLVIFLLLGLVAGIVGAKLIERHMVYDYMFFHRCAEVSDLWAEQLRQQERPCVVMAGGSETRMGVDPAVMLEKLDVPAINAAGNAGFGLRCNVAAAWPYLRSGDTLLVSVSSPQALSEEAPSAGLKFCFNRQGLGFFSSGLVSPTPKNLSSLFLGDIDPLVIALGRRFRTYEQRYRYHRETVVHPSGWVEVQYRQMQGAPCAEKDVSSVPTASPKGVEEFVKLQQQCRDKGVELVLHMRVSFTGIHERVRVAQVALIFTRAGIPVLKDTRLGAVQDSYSFADTDLHLSPPAARENSLLIARSLKEKSYWTEAELIQALRSYGWQGELPELPSAE